MQRQAVPPWFHPVRLSSVAASESAPPNNARQRTRAKSARAAELRRVCQAWHRTSEVQVLVPGIRGAEGEEQGKGVHREVGSGGSPIQTCGATNRNRI